MVSRFIIVTEINIFFFDFNLFLYCPTPDNTGKVYAGYYRVWSSWVGHSVVWLMDTSVLEEQPPYQTYGITFPEGHNL